MRTSLQPELEQRIGRNLLRYQLVELRLKQALPLRHITLSMDGVQELQKLAEALRKQTLGKLGQALADMLEFSLPDGRETFLSSLQQFLDARNWLVHHLLQDSSLLSTEDAARTCIARLDADYLAAEGLARQVMEIHQFILQSVQTYVDDWASSAPTNSMEMRELSMRTAAKLGSVSDGPISVNLEVPALEALADAMQILDCTQRRPDGWVLFNTVAETLRRDYGSTPPKLLAIARQVPGFEFDLRDVRPGGGPAWMFRKTPQSVQ